MSTRRNRARRWDGRDGWRRGELSFFLALAMVLSGCSLATTPATIELPRTGHIAVVTNRTLVQGAATLFMQRFRSGNFVAQWAQLAPQTREAWPSAAARAAMLRHKFGGIHIRSVTLGHPVFGAGWTSQENTRLSVARTWQVPVTVAFATPARLRPAGVAAAYTHLALALIITRQRRALVLGEGPASLDAPLITPSHPANVQASVPILMYHRVGPYPLRQQWTDDYGYDIEYGLTVPPAQFAVEMRYLAAHHYSALSLTRLAASLLYGLPVPKRAVVLTFDDGRQSPWYDAVPLLRRYGFTATFFVCSGFVGQTNETPAHLNVQRYLSWAQVTALARMGFWIEDHGQKDINPLWGLPVAELRTEVQRSAHILSAHTHRPIQFVAYTGALWPYPQASQAGPEEWALFPRLAALGYVGAVVDARVPSTEETTEQIWQLPRVRVSPGERTASFAASLTP